MSEATEPERLDVLANLFEADPDASRQADSWAKG